MAQYLNYGVYQDKMYGLNVLLAQNKYKTIAKIGRASVGKECLE